MQHIDLNLITNEHILGKWRVHSRSASRHAETDYFSSIHTIDIGKENFIAHNGKDLSGRLSMIREYEIIYNPQLKFYRNTREIANAIITRMILETDGGCVSHKMTLYFTSGLELVLLKN